jgi:hypothetical protein
VAKQLLPLDEGEVSVGISNESLSVCDKFELGLVWKAKGQISDVDLKTDDGELHA